MRRSPRSGFKWAPPQVVAASNGAFLGSKNGRRQDHAFGVPREWPKRSHFYEFRRRFSSSARYAVTTSVRGEYGAIVNGEVWW